MKNSFIVARLKALVVFVALIAVASVAFLPSVSSAYALLDQSVVQLNENTFLFQIEYRLNYLNYDTFGPIVPYLIDGEVSTTSPLMQYSFVDEEGNKLSDIENTSLVLSQADIVGTQYYIADRNSSPFVLTSIVTLSPEQVASGESLALQVDWLPFTLRKDGEEKVTAVREVDLTEFKTSAISW